MSGIKGSGILMYRHGGKETEGRTQDEYRTFYDSNQLENENTDPTTGCPHIRIGLDRISFSVTL